MPTDNITVLDHLFNLTKNSNVIGRLSYDLTQFFDNLAVAYFFGPPCNCSCSRWSCMLLVRSCLKRKWLPVNIAFNADQIV